MEIVPISSLSPSSALPTDCGFKALITLLWPFSSTTGQCALLLADPDARQRRQKGQVRVRFTGPSARQIAASGIGIGDSVQVALVGVQWLTESDTALVKTPGRSVDGELLFKNRLHMTITRGQAEPRTIDVDESIEHMSPKPSMLPPSTPIARFKPRTSFDAYGVAVYSSPAFMKRLRLSEVGSPYSPMPVSEDDDQDTVASRKRRRVSYKNVSEWKFDAREPSPEKDQIDVLDVADGDEDLVAGAAVPETITVENDNVTEQRRDLDKKDAVEPTEAADHQAEQPASNARSKQEHTTQSAHDTVANDSSVEIVEDEPLQTEAQAEISSESAAGSSKAKETEEREVEAVVQQAVEATRSAENSADGAPQTSESSMASQFQISTPLDMPPSTLPRLTILPTESELLEQMARARTIDRPTTPILQPLLTEGLPLPSPFPTSAQKIPSPVVPNIAGTSQTTENETGVKDAAETAAHTRNELSPASEFQTKFPQQESGQQLEAASQTPRVVVDTYDGYAEGNPVVLSSGSEDEDEGQGEGEAGSSGRSSMAASSPVAVDEQVKWRSRGDRFDDESSADEESDMESSSGVSESDDASSVYNSEQIIALQEQSDGEGAIEEPDWDYLEHKLEQEEAALRQSREDLTARDSGLIEVADDLEEGDEADDAVMHDDNSELDEEILARSDDDSADDDSDGSGYFDQIVLPDAEDESREESEVDLMDQPYQFSMPENDIYSHPFGLDGARTLTETRTALPSQAVSEAGSAIGDDTIAWRDRDAAVKALDQQMQRQSQPKTTEQVVQKPPAQNIPPPSSSRLDVVELLDDSDPGEEDVDIVTPFKHNYHHMPLEAEQQQLRQQTTSTPPRVRTQHAQEVESHSAVQNKTSEQGSAPQAFETQRDPVSTNPLDKGEQRFGPAVVESAAEQRTLTSEKSQIEPEVHATSKLAHADTTAPPSADPAQVMPVREEDLNTRQSSPVEKDVERQDNSGADEFEMMGVEAESIGSDDEHEIDPVLLGEEHEIDPALLEQTDSANPSRLEGYEIDPALLQEEHEIDPALLTGVHDDLSSNSHPNLLQVDDAMSEAPEPDALSVADGEESEKQSIKQDPRAAVTGNTKNELPTPQNDGAAVAQVHEVPLKLVQQSVETDPDTLERMEVDTTPLQASLKPTDEIEDSHMVREELRPLSSSSFKTLSPTPDAVRGQPPGPNARSTDQAISDVTTHMLDQPIEELDLSQVEPSWTSRFSQLSQSRSSRAHTRSETIPDSADEEATDLEAENGDIHDRPTSPDPATQATLLQGAQSASMVQPSQELGTGLSRSPKPKHGASEMQSQLAAIEETTLPEGEGVAEEMRSQVGLDDELLADYVQAPEPEATSARSPSPSESSTAMGTKKPARPLTLFRGRKSVGVRASVGDDEQRVRDTEQQDQDSQKQIPQDEMMQDLSSREANVPATIETVTESTTDGEGRVRDAIDANLVSTSSATSKNQPQTAQKAQGVTETTKATVAAKLEETTSIEQAPEVEQASSDLRIKPTLKPFAEVEASLFGTPIKGKTAQPQAPQSAPSQFWRNALSSKMSEVPAIGSWFTPRRTTEIQKAATEHKATASSSSFVEETPTKVATMPKAKQPSREREKTISPPPLQRYASQGTSTSLSYFTPLAGLHQHLNQQSSLIDIVAVCTTATSMAERAKSGPKDYYTTFRVVDQPLHEYHTASQDEGPKDVRIEIFRPYQQSLPTASPGDVVLLRGFVVRSRNHEKYLLSTAASGWCVWRYCAPSSTTLDYDGQEEEDDRPVWARRGTSQRVGEDGAREEVTGPPVEIGDEEREKVTIVRTWWEGLQKQSKDEGKEGHDIVMID